MAWHDKHTGPKDSGSQDNEGKSGGSASPNFDKGGVHLTDWDSKGNRVSWDESSKGESGHHSTPSDKK